MNHIKIIIISWVILSSAVYADDEIVKAEVMNGFKKSLYLGVETNDTTIVAVGERGHIAYSTDYGSTWEQSKNVPTRTTLTAVSIINNNVWAVGHDTIILYSSDSGKNWEIQFEDKDRQMPLLDVLFINESEGFAIGAYGTYLTTYDGGKNWNDALISEDHDFHLNKIIKVDEYKYFVVAEAGNAYRSFDAGKNWENIELPYTGSMFGVVSFNGKIITYGLRGNVLASDDFGETFIQLDSPIQDSLFGSEKILKNKLFLVGANGAVLEYKDMSLNKINLSNGDGDFTELIAIKNNKLVFVGESGISTTLIGK